MIFNENSRVKIPALIHFLKLGYNYIYLTDKEKKNENIIHFNTKIHIQIFQESISRINNKYFEDNEIQKILKKIEDYTISGSTEPFYKWLIEPENNELDIKLIDFDNPYNNDFSIMPELPFLMDKNSENGSFRPDITIFINGMPISFFETKIPNNPGGIQTEFERMLKSRLIKKEYKKFFALMQLICFSNNMEYEKDSKETKAGSFYAIPNGENTTFQFFREQEKDFITNYHYKKINNETLSKIIENNNYEVDKIITPEFETNSKINTPCNRFITSLYDKERLLFILKYGINLVGNNERHIIRYPQFFAIKNIFTLLNYNEKSGIIWHTQGTGKTELVSFACRVFKEYFSNIGIEFIPVFVVDRLSLLIQHKNKFIKWGFNVRTYKSIKDFKKSFRNPFSTNKNNKEITIINIQKFPNETIDIKNEFNKKYQFFYFVDEAHRSYSTNGEYYSKIKTIGGNDAIYIALTGTPILKDLERTNIKFGRYIHKYFYSESINDGYTIKIKKENIKSNVNQMIKRNIQLETDTNFKPQNKSIYESNDFINDVSQFIADDFNEFRIINNDFSLGAIVFAYSNPQAKKIQKYIEETYNKNNNLKIKTGLVLCDSENPQQDLKNKENQENFTEKMSIDLLIVHYMLSTGFDSARLKKAYLLREPKDATLLQTLTRVNRPYKNPTTKEPYNYGYIVDFVDIQNGYNKTIDAYIKEAQDISLTEEKDFVNDIKNAIVNIENLKQEYIEQENLFKEIVNINDSTFNMEEFNIKLTEFTEHTLRTLKKISNNLLQLKREFLLSNISIKTLYDKETLKQCIKLINNRLDFICISEKNIDSEQFTQAISNPEIVSMIYEFIKINSSILDLENRNYESELKQNFAFIKQDLEYFEQNQCTKEYKRIQELLNELFQKMNISNNLTIEEMQTSLYNIIDESNFFKHNLKLAREQYDGKFSIVKTKQDIINNYSSTIGIQYLEEIIDVIYYKLKQEMLENPEYDFFNSQEMKNYGFNRFNKTISNIMINFLLKEKKELFNKICAIYENIIKCLYENIVKYEVIK